MHIYGNPGKSRACTGTCDTWTDEVFVHKWISSRSYVHSHTYIIHIYCYCADYECGSSATHASEWISWIIIWSMQWSLPKGHGGQLVHGAKQNLSYSINKRVECKDMSMIHINPLLRIHQNILKGRLSLIAVEVGKGSGKSYIVWSGYYWRTVWFYTSHENVLEFCEEST